MTWRPAKDDDEPRRLGESLEHWARRLGAPGAGALATVFARWPELAGPGVAAHARPVSLREGTLVVAVDEPGWATQLRYLSAALLERLAEALGEGSVARLEVRVEGAGRARR